MLDLAALAAAHQIPGLIVAGSLQGTPFATASGMRILGQPAAITPADRMHIGSVTKPFTATLAGIFVDQGTVSFETTIGDVFADWPLHPRLQPVMLADLLGHYAGLPSYEEEADFAALPTFDGSPLEQRHAFCRHVLSQAPAFEPGTEMHYSNAGFSVAAAMLERAVDSDWHTLVRQTILAPLQLASAGFGWPARDHADAPWGHQLVNEVLIPHDPFDAYQLTSLIAPAGDLHMSLPDLVRFGELHLAGLQGADGVLRASTVQRLHTPRGKSGLGWGVYPALGMERISAHSGSADTFLTLLVVAPEAELVVAVGANAMSEAVEEGCKAALRTVVQQATVR